MDSDASTGDRVEIRTEKGVYSGILMPKHAFSREGIVLIKLDSGYNMTVPEDEILEMKIVERIGKREGITGKAPRGIGPKIALINTGGTIASYVDYRTGAVHPAMSSEELLFSVLELSGIADVEADVLFSVLSENIEPKHWSRMAEKAAEALNSGKEGVIIAHGTDTMGYSAAALSFALSNLNGPVVFVGSQRSSDRPSSDATMNLLSAAQVAVSNLGEVAVVMHASTSDDYCHVHRGNRVRKMHTSRRDAFVSPNSRPIGKAWPEGVELHDYRKKSDGDVEVRPDFSDKIALVYAYPGMSEDILDSILSRSDGIVIAGTGLGHVKESLIGTLKSHIKDGKTVVMTSQCLYGTVNMNVYSTGRDLIKAGVVPGGDMLPETAYVKLSWALANLDCGIAEFMRRNIAGEMEEARYL